MKHENKLLTISIIALITILAILLISNYTNSKKGDLKQITYKEIVKKQENKEDFILIVSQSTCSHCASYKPKVKEIAKDYGIIVYYIDIDLEKDEDKVLDALNLGRSTPMTLFFIEGKEKSVLNRIEGDLSFETVKKQFKKMGFID